MRKYSALDGVLVDDKTGKKLKAKVGFDSGGHIFVCIEGYGDKYSCDGHGCPLLVDYFDGVVKAVVWGDINKDDPTVKVDLEGAKESNRQKDA